MQTVDEIHDEIVMEIYKKDSEKLKKLEEEMKEIDIRRTEDFRKINNFHRFKIMQKLEESKKFSDEQLAEILHHLDYYFKY